MIPSSQLGVDRMTIWEFQHTLSRRLLKWSGVSAALGLIMSLMGRFWNGVGSQFIGWAAVNAAIAVGGNFVSQQRRVREADSALPKGMMREASKLQRLLWINAVLDIFYMLGGLWLLGRGREKPRLRGIGLGILLQGLSLFVFDIIHARQVPTWPWSGSDPS